MALWRTSNTQRSAPAADSIDPYHFTRREPAVLKLSERCVVDPEQPPGFAVHVIDDGAVLTHLRVAV